MLKLISIDVNSSIVSKGYDTRVQTFAKKALPFGKVANLLMSSQGCALARFQ